MIKSEISRITGQSLYQQAVKGEGGEAGAGPTKNKDNVNTRTSLDQRVHAIRSQTRSNRIKFFEDVLTKLGDGYRTALFEFVQTRLPDAKLKKKRLKDKSELSANDIVDFINRLNKQLSIDDTEALDRRSSTLVHAPLAFKFAQLVRKMCDYSPARNRDDNIEYHQTAEDIVKGICSNGGGEVMFASVTARVKHMSDMEINIGDIAHELEMERRTLEGYKADDEAEAKNAKIERNTSDYSTTDLNKDLQNTSHDTEDLTQLIAKAQKLESGRVELMLNQGKAVKEESPVVSLNRAIFNLTKRIAAQGKGDRLHSSPLIGNDLFESRVLIVSSDMSQLEDKDTERFSKLTEIYNQLDASLASLFGAPSYTVEQIINFRKK